MDIQHDVRYPARAVALKGAAALPKPVEAGYRIECCMCIILPKNPANPGF